MVKIAMKYPIIFDYQECMTYLKDFYELNKTLSSSVSYRSLAFDLKWPNSYLNDIILGRKNLTLPRALEFAKFANFNLLETERLICMAMVSSGTFEVQNYFVNKLAKEHNSDSYTQNPEKNYASNIDDLQETIEELRGDIAASAILKLLVWSKGSIELKKIPKILFSFPELSDFKIVNEKIDKLVKNKNIKILSSDSKEILKVEILKSAIYFMITKETASMIAGFPENVARILNHEKVTGVFNLGFLVINKNRSKEIRLKINELRNWMLEVEKEALEDDRLVLTDTLLFQYDINLVPIIDMHEVGLGSIQEWEDSV
jgi:hypothetical protein